MTKKELLRRLSDIEWDDFEVKEAKDKLPENVWETVSAFSNTSGGWIVFGVSQHGKKFDVQGVNNGEKTADRSSTTNFILKVINTTSMASWFWLS